MYDPGEKPSRVLLVCAVGVAERGDHHLLLVPDKIMPYRVQEQCPCDVYITVEPDGESEVEDREECGIERVPDIPERPGSTEPFAPVRRRQRPEAPSDDGQRQHNRGDEYAVPEKPVTCYRGEAELPVNQEGRK